MSPFITQSVNLLTRFGAPSGGCTKSGPLGLPTWYKYLPTSNIDIANMKNVCKINLDLTGNPAQIWLIGLAVIDILLRIGVLVAIGFIIYGGFQYMVSQGEPDRTTAAKNTILNAVIGLVITIIATAAVSYIGSQLGG